MFFYQRKKTGKIVVGSYSATVGHLEEEYLKRSPPTIDSLISPESLGDWSGRTSVELLLGDH